MASPKHHKAPGSSRKANRAPLVLRRTMLHSCLCFLLGLVTGLAPSDWAHAASRAAADANAQVMRTAAQLLASSPPPPQHHQKPHHQKPQLLVVVTTTAPSERERRAAGLTRTAHALRLVSPPVLWLVVEAAAEAPPTAHLLRRTGVAYRHLTYDDNLTSPEEERHHQRNVALGHMERHRLRGVVLFAGLADVYDLRLLEHLRRNIVIGYTLSCLSIVFIHWRNQLFCRWNGTQLG